MNQVSLPLTEKPSGLQSMGCKESDTTERLTLSLLRNSQSNSALCPNPDPL